jgi:hypothetical protein
MNLDCESPPPPPTSTERKRDCSETNEDADAISVQGTSSGDEQEVTAEDLVSAFDETMPAKKGRGRAKKATATVHHGLAHGPAKKRTTGKATKRGGRSGGGYTKAEMLKIVNDHIASKFRAAAGR